VERWGKVAPGGGKNRLYNILVMEARMYIYKYSVMRGRPNLGWLLKCRWYLCRWEDSPRFKHVESAFERWRVPRVDLGHRKGYIVLKVQDVREFLHYVAPDLLYDVIISDQRIKALEDEQWELEVVKFDVGLYALWKVGLQTKAETKLTEARALYEKIVAELKAKAEKIQGEKR
jgi:hypothetical protein